MRLHHTTIVYESAPWGRGAELELITGTRCRVIYRDADEITVRFHRNRQHATFTRRALIKLVRR
ncbi:hypothetical protein [Chromobacterium violaceum]